jgi:hypothetical protein
MNTTEDVIVDLGASVNIVDEVTYFKLLKPNCELKQAKANIFAYGSSKPLPLRVKFTVLVLYKTKMVDTTFCVIKGDSGPLLSCQTATDLGLLKLINSLSTPSEPVDGSFISQLPNEYQDLFQGIGKLRLSSEAAH